jgi:hypothetical protein
MGTSFNITTFMNNKFTQISLFYNFVNVHRRHKKLAVRPHFFICWITIPTAIWFFWKTEEKIFSQHNFLPDIYTYSSADKTV